MAASSGITGLILPGIIEEPGCSAGKLISANPVFGPDASSRKSFEMRITSSAKFRKADDTAAIVEELGLPMVRLIRQPNRGKPAALNTGVAAASNALIVMMDGDTVFEPSTVRELVLARYPFLRSSAFERRMLFQRANERRPSPAVVTSAFDHTSIVPQQS